MARKPKRSHRAYKEWAPSVRELEQNIIIITHGKINGRATVNLKISILDSLIAWVWHTVLFLN